MAINTPPCIIPGSLRAIRQPFNLRMILAAALAATPMRFNTAECIDTDPDGEYDCPLCAGNGYLIGRKSYFNFDSEAIGVQFFGIGQYHQAAEAFFRAANPAVVAQMSQELMVLKQKQQLNNQLSHELQLAQQKIAKLEEILQQAIRDHDGWQDEARDFFATNDVCSETTR